MRIALLAVILFIVPLAHARGVYMSPEDFITGAFGKSQPRPRVMWLTKDIRPGIRAILGHDPKVMRLRYWADDGRSAWILEEIGKEEPITVGIVVEKGHIEQMQVLVYRESRGSEVRHPFFTSQFSGATLGDDMMLDRTIDGISGATLSVRALKKLARLALYLDQQRKH